jgi:hypothetical protein
MSTTRYVFDAWKYEALELSSRVRYMQRIRAVKAWAVYTRASVLRRRKRSGTPYDEFSKRRALQKWANFVERRRQQREQLQWARHHHLSIMFRKSWACWRSRAMQSEAVAVQAMWSKKKVLANLRRHARKRVCMNILMYDCMMEGDGWRWMNE